MILINLAAGLALISFGVRYLRKGLDRLLGGRLIAWLRTATGNRFSAWGAGIAAGAAAPSSTSLSLLTAQILREEDVQATSMLAMLLGGSIGITFLSHLVSFNLKDYAGIFLFVGVLGFQFSQRQTVRGIGQCLLALGFIFLSMRFLGDGAAQLASNHDLNVVLGVLTSHPLLLVLLAGILAVLLQSSTATIGLGIGFANGGVLNEQALVPWVIGTNLGLGITSLLVCWGTLEGRRLGWANLMAKAAVALAIGGLFSAQLIPTANGSISLTHLLPIWHTLFNLIVALVALPLLSPLLFCAKAFFAPDPTNAKIEDDMPTTFLDPQALETPSIALAFATRETLRLADEVRHHIQHLALARGTANIALARRVKLSDARIDQLNQEIILYLSKLGSDLGDYDRKWQLTLFNFSNELETVGDVIEKTLCDAVIKQLTEQIVLPPEEEKIIYGLFSFVIRRIDVASSLVTDRSISRAKDFLAEKKKLDESCVRAKQDHLRNLHSTDRRGLHVSLCFLDMMDALRRINSHISSVAYSFVPLTHRSREARTADVSTSMPSSPASVS